MSIPSVNVFSEPELVELLGDEPELIAVADAIAETQRGRRRRSWPGRVTVAAVAAAVAGGLLVVAPWRGGNEPSLVDRALAAVGSGPVVHAVLQHEDGSGPVSVDLATGRERPLVTTTEIWFDEKRGLEHTIGRLDGRVQDETLQTRREVITSRGAHPLAGGPWVDPALAEFVDGYRDALKTGRARPVGDGSVDGRPVTWLSFALQNGGSQRVAIDKETSLPLRIVTRWGGPPSSYSVREIQALPEGGGDFSAPRVLTGPQPPYSFMREPTPIAPDAATRVVSGALALGSSFGGLALTKVVETKLSTLFEPEAHREPLVSKGLEFVYGSYSLLDGRPYLWVVEADKPLVQNGWLRSYAPAHGTVVLARSGLVGGSGPAGMLVENGIFVTILASDRTAILEAARALRPFEPS